MDTKDNYRDERSGEIVDIMKVEGIQEDWLLSLLCFS